MPCAFGTAGEPSPARGRGRRTATDGRDLVAGVTTPEPYVRGEGPLRVVAYDYGVKETMLRHLAGMATVDRGARLHPGGRRAGPRARRRLPLQRPR